jgi:large subunit ribosomal protein L29
MKAREWREKSIGEREKTLVELQDKLRKLRFDLATREAKNSSEHSKIRKDIARILTLKCEAEASLDEAGESR